MNSSQHLQIAIDVARKAGLAILEQYDLERRDLEPGAAAMVFEKKADNSPLTLADRAAHASIVAAFSEATPEVPVLSEESSAVEIEARRTWQTLWVVDPLDGTKEFIKRSGQFTVNIALVEGERPLLGVVHVPTSGVTYFASRDGGAFRQDGDDAPVAISTRSANLEQLVIVASRDHAGPEVDAFLKRLKGAQTTSMGSSLKFCLVAEGKADFYPRTVPTMEWDTAAAQCIVEVAGGAVTDFTGAPLIYNREDLRNPSIVSYGDPSIDWIQLFG